MTGTLVLHWLYYDCASLSVTFSPLPFPSLQTAILPSSISHDHGPYLMHDKSVCQI